MEADMHIPVCCLLILCACGVQVQGHLRLKPRMRTVTYCGHSSHLRLSFAVRAAMTVARFASLESLRSSRTTSKSPSATLNTNISRVTLC